MNCKQLCFVIRLIKRKEKNCIHRRVRSLRFPTCTGVFGFINKNLIQVKF